MIRVLHVTGIPEGGVIGLLLSLHRSIDRDDIQFDYIMPDSAPFASAAAKIEALGGKVFKAPALNYRNYFKLNGFFDNFFKERPEYKIVHVHGPNIAIICLKNAKKYGVPHRLCHSHNTKYADDPIRAIRNRLLLSGLENYVTGYFACSKAAGEFLFGDQSVYVLKNGIPVEKFAFDAVARENLRRECKLDNEFVIGNVGLLRQQKNHAFTLKILQSYRRLYSEGKLLLVGDGELRGKLEQMSMDLGVREHVVFAGMREDVPELMSAMDAFVMPSFYEGLGIVLIEAQTSGLPCVYSDVIPPDVRLTNLAHPLSLSETAETWAEAIHAARTAPRHSRTREISEAGYDIRVSASELTAYYQCIMMS